MQIHTTAHVRDAAADARPAFLMCAPRLYDVNYVINPWMEGNLHQSSRERAHAQWDQLHAALSRIARVLLIEPAPGWPDMVFTANAGLVHHDAVAISRFHHAERQGEEPHFRQWFSEAGYRLLELARETPFEGEGDALFSADNTRLWVGHGPRTAAASHDALRAAWNVEVTSLHLVDPRFYHLDTCFAPLTGGFLLYYPAAFDAASLRAIEAFYPPSKRIAVSEADALCFACNAVNVGRTLLLNHISPDLRTRLEAGGFTVIEIALDEFLKAGGAAKCLVMRLNPALHRAETPSSTAGLLSTLAATVVPATQPAVEAL